MKGICIGYKGTEEVMQKEVEEIIGRKSNVEDSAVVFETDNEKDFAKLIYLGQSFLSVMQFLYSGSVTEFDDVAKIKFDYSLLKGRKFKVLCTRHGDHNFSSVDAAEKLGETIFEATNSKADMKNPEVLVHIFIIKEKCYVGIDYAGIELDTRDYKVYQQPDSMKGPLAYFMVRYSGYTPDKFLVDTFCGCGAIPIEAGFFASKFPINKFRKNKLMFVKMGIMDEKELEKLDNKKDIKGKILGMDKEIRFIENAKRNAKIGGVEKDIEFSRNDIEWLEIKFEDESVDFIVTDAPRQNRRMDENRVKKIYAHFFHQAKFILKKEGRICVINNSLLEEFAGKEGFAVDKKVLIEKNSQLIEVAMYKKAKV